jgi:hypothetical protein
MSSAPAGAVGSGLFGSAGVVSGAAGTAGLTGGTTGAAGLAGLGGLGAVGMSHMSAVAGLAVASVVAALGLPADRSSGEPAESPPAFTTVVPDDAATTDESSGALVEPTVDLSEPPLSTDDPTNEGTVAESGTANALSSVEMPGGEAGTVSGGVQVPADPEATGDSGLAESVPDTAPSADGEPGQRGGAGGPESPGAQPFGDGVPTTPQGQGGNNWPWSDGEATGPGQPGSAPHSGSGKPEHAVEPREGPAVPARPDQAVERTSPTPDLFDKPAHAAESTSPARTSRHRRGTPARVKGRHRRR